MKQEIHPRPRHRKSSWLPLSVCAAILLASGTEPVRATDWYWDADGDTTTTTGGTGNWTLAGVLWRNGSSTGTLTAYNDAAGPQNDTAANLVLAGGTDSLTMTLSASTSYNLNKITANNTYTLSPNSATLTFVGTTPAVNVASGKTLVWSTDLSAASATVTKSGAGTWQFNNTGGQITSNNTTIDITAGTFQFNTSASTASLFTGTGGIVKAGSGTTLSLVQTYSGGYTSARTWTLGSKVILNGGTFNSGGTTGALFMRLLSTTAVQIDAASTIAQSSGSYGQLLAIEGSVTGAGNLNLNRANAATSSNRFLSFKGDMSGYSGNVTIGTSTSAGYVIFGHSTGWGSGTLTLTGSGSRVVLGDEAATVVNSGWTGGSALGFTSGTMTTNAAVTVGSGAQLLVNNRSGSAVLFEPRAGLTVNGGTLGANSSGGTSAFVPYTSTTWTFGGSALSTVSGNVRLDYAGATFQVADAVAGTGVDALFSGTISGANGFAKTGAGTMNVTGSNSYAGTTSVTAGILALGSADALGTTGTISMNGGTLQFSASNTTDYTSSGRLRLEDGTNSFFDTNGQDVVFGSALGVGTLGTGGMGKTGAGTLTLGGANTYSGATTVTGGTLAVAADSALGAVPGTATPGTIVLNGGTLSTTGSFTLSSTRGIAVGPTTGTGNGTIDVVAGATLAYGGIVANNGGTGNLVKTGTGTLTLTGAGTWTGSATVSAGTLEVTAKSGNVAYTVAQGATLKLGYSTGGSYTPGITLNGNGLSDPAGLYLKGGINFQTNSGLLIQTAPTTIRSYGSGNATHQGFDVNGSYFLSNTADASGSVMASSININTGSYGYKVLANVGSATSTGDLVIDGVIAGGGNAQVAGESMATGLDKRGAGSLKLTGASTYSFATSINAGSIIASGGDNRLPVGTSVVLGNGGTSGRLVLEGISQTIGDLAVNGTGTANAVVGGSSTMSTLTVNYSGTGRTFSGNIGGAGANENNISLMKTGSGTLTLSGTNTYTGPTVVAAGVLAFSGSGSISSSTTIEVQGTGSVDATSLVGGWTVGAGQTLKGAGTLSGAVTIAGTHSPGFSPGTQSFSGGLTYSSTGNLVWELIANSQANRGTDFDAVNVTGGAFSLDPAALINLSFGGSVDFVDTFWTTDHEWLVVDLQGAATAADTNLFTLGTISGGLHYDSALGDFGLLRKDGSTTADAVYLTWTAAPEPTSGLLVLLGLLPFIRRRRA